MTAAKSLAVYRAAFAAARIVVRPSAAAKVAARVQEFRAAGWQIDNLFLNVENP